MRIAVIPAYNEELTIGQSVLLARKQVDRVIVIDDGSMDRTAQIAVRAGAEVIRNPTMKGYGEALSIGFSKALEMNPDYIVTLNADIPEDVLDLPDLAAPVESGKADIAIRNSMSNVRVYGRAAFPILRIMYKGMSSNAAILQEAVSLQLRIIQISDIADRRPKRLGFRMVDQLFDQHILKEHDTQKIQRLSTQQQTYDERRRVQRELAGIESYKLVCETFLRFIPPALLSLIISLVVIVPATGYRIDASIAIPMIVSIVVLFIIARWMLMTLLDREHQRLAYIGQVEIRDEEIRHQLREKWKDEKVKLVEPIPQQTEA